MRGSAYGRKGRSDGQEENRVDLAQALSLVLKRVIHQALAQQEG